VATQPTHTATDLAERFALGLRGDGSVAVRGVATLARAGRDQLAFLAARRMPKASPAPRWSPSIRTLHSRRSPRCSNSAKRRHQAYMRAP
jgi:hypothetical protein